VGGDTADLIANELRLSGLYCVVKSRIRRVRLRPEFQPPENRGSIHARQGTKKADRRALSGGLDDGGLDSRSENGRPARRRALRRVSWRRR
jgi:hypothetical protein